MPTTSILTDMKATCAKPPSLAVVHDHHAFTLLELLTVIAIVGILAALIFPGVSAARRSAGKAKTKVQFSQWAAAIESFRSEYGYYPVFDANGLVNGGATAVYHPFHDLLAARHRDGSSLGGSETAAVQNRKLIAFHSFTDGNFTSSGLLRDAFDQTEIAVLVDRDLDGVIRQGADFTALPAVDGLTPGTPIIPAAGVRAGVIFYAPAPGATATNPEFILSWK
jgi:prepilin-type N-terminal cleavage/methylation domain-containing protein